MLHAPNYETEPMEIGKLKGYHLGTENGREYYEGVDGRKFSFPSADFTKITFEDEGKEVVKLPTEKTDGKEVVKLPTEKTDEKKPVKRGRKK